MDVATQRLEARIGTASGGLIQGVAHPWGRREKGVEHHTIKESALLDNPRRDAAYDILDPAPRGPEFWHRTPPALQRSGHEGLDS
jgi:hypothetical protein